MADNRLSKMDRILHIYTSLLNGETISIKELSDEFETSEKTVRREVEAIGLFLSDYNTLKGGSYEIINLESSRKETGRYRLKNSDTKYFSRAEILIIFKILMDSRSLTLEEMDPILDKLLASAVLPEDRNYIKSLMQNEWYNYTEPSHGKPIIDNILEVAKAIKESRLIRIKYVKTNRQEVERIIEPLGIIFSEYYFYLAGNIRNIDKEKYFEVKGDENPTMYRIDRINSIETLDERYTVSEIKRFKEGEYRKRIQFMMGGELNRLTLLVKDFALEAVRDHLPAAGVEKLEGQEYDYKVKAELFGEGILMWLMGQGQGVKLTGPDHLVKKLRDKIAQINSVYTDEKSVQ